MSTKRSAPWVLGITGGIGSGKSTAGAFFAGRGIPVIDADAASRRLTQAGGAGICAVRQAFGGEFIASDGAMDRAKMRELVFAHPKEREKLEGILRPFIASQCLSEIEAAKAEAAKTGAAFVAFDCPLLFEWPSARALADRILLIDLDEEAQIRRAAERSKLAPETVRKIIAAQMPRAEKIAAADDIIFNGSSREAFLARLETLLVRYSGL